MEDEFYDAIEDWDEAQHSPVDHEPDVTGFSSPASPFPLHHAAFNNDIATVQNLLKELPETEVKVLDRQGNTAFHVAVIRQHTELVAAMIDAEFPTYVRSSRGWSPLMEAVETRNRKLAHAVARAEILQMKAKLKSKKSDLLETLKQLPDFSMKMSWELGSTFPGLGLLIKRYAPHDTYTMWKRGATIRVDGSLMGIDRHSQSIIPEWKRGHFSIIYDGSQEKPQTWFLNHKRKKFVDITEDRRKFKGAEMNQFAREVDELLEQPQVEMTKMKARDFKFMPVKGWLGGDMTEKVEGWQTKVFEAAGKMVAVRRVKTPYHLKPEATFEDYLAMPVPEDVVVEDAVDPLNPRMLGGGKTPGGSRHPHAHRHPDHIHTVPPTHPPDPSVSSGDAFGMGSEVPGDMPPQTEKAKKKAKRVTARCWMAKEFPLSLRQLLPLLDVMGTANKHIAKVSKFMNKFGDMNLFPVKVQVPLVMTVYALLSFKEFTVMEAGTSSCPEPDFFKVPEDYVRGYLEDFTGMSSSSSDSAIMREQQQGTGLRPPHSSSEADMFALDSERELTVHGTSSKAGALANGRVSK